MAETALYQEPDDDFAENEDSKKALKRWVNEIKFYETRAKQWETKSNKLIRRYKDVRTPREAMPARYNILWSNTELLTQAVYGRCPKPDIDRRYRDNDDIGRTAAQILERCTTYFVGEQYNQAVQSAVLDLMLPGRGTVWVRYEPHFKDMELTQPNEVADEGLQITDDNDEDDKDPQQEVADETLVYDYVHWQDYGHSFGRCWEEIDAHWRKVYLTRDELKERFGDEMGEKVPLDYSPEDIKDTKIDEVQKKATIYEVWCKSERCVYWLHKDYQDGILDMKDDPLGLEEFFPDPKPLFSCVANDEMIPVPFYVQYQDQAIELDQLTSRIASITKSVKVAGVYDASAEGVQRLLAEGVENQLIPVEQWAVLSEKGGLAGVMGLMPMKDILDTLLGLYEARDKVKNDLYEITGISDILRGASDPDETYGAQRIKSQFGTLRLSKMQDDVQRFCRDLVKIGTQVIANHFSLDTIRKISGIDLLTAEEKQVVQGYISSLGSAPNGGGPMQPPQVGQGSQPIGIVPPAPPPMPLPKRFAKMDPEDIEELIEEPTWEEVYDLLRTEPLLAYKIDIQTDSTIKLDQDADKQSRVEFLTAMGTYLKEALNVPPPMAPFAAKSLMFMMRGFPIGKELEAAAEVMIKKLEKAAQNPPPQQPNPDIMKIQAETQANQQKMQFDSQLEQQRMQADQQLEAFKAQAEEKRLQLQAQVDTNQSNLDAQNAQLKAQMDDQFNRWKTQVDNETKIIVANIQAKTQLQTAQIGQSDGTSVDENGNTVKGPSMSDLLTTVVTQLQQALGNVAQTNAAMVQSHHNLIKAMTAPSQIIRDNNGNMIGVAKNYSPTTESVN